MDVRLGYNVLFLVRVDVYVEVYVYIVIYTHVSIKVVWAILFLWGPSSVRFRDTYILK
jgi:hypothetical protein